MLKALKYQLEWMFRYINSGECPTHYRIKVSDHVKEQFRHQYNYLQIIHKDIEGNYFIPKVSL